MTLLEQLRNDDRVLKSIAVLGEEEEELHYSCTAKQLSSSKKKRRVAIGLTHLALYVFEMESGPKYMRCIQRIRTIELTGIYIARGGLVSKALINLEAL
jgi:hypothetical protein